MFAVAQPNRRRPHALIVAAGLAASLSLQAQAPAASSLGIVYGERPPEINHMNPYAGVGRPGTKDRVLSMLFEPLFRYRFGAETWEGVLAADYVRTTAWRGQSAFIIRLRNAKWHDGTPVTPADVAFTYRYIRLTAADHQLRALHTRVIADVRPGDRPGEVIVEFVNPVEDPRIYLRDPIIPSSQFNADLTSRSPGLNGHPIGSGPFAFEAFSRGNPRLRQFEGYHGAVAKLAFMEHRLFTDAPTQLASLESGDIQMMVEVPPTDLARLEANERFAVSPLASLHVYAVAMRQRAGSPLANQSVRRAITMAINREQLLQNWFGGKGEVVASPVSSQSHYFDPSIEALPFDPAQARRLLEQAGAIGTQLRFHYPTTRGTDTRFKDLVRAIVDALNGVGLRVVELPQTSAEFDASLFEGEGSYDLALVRWEFNEAYDFTPLFRDPGTNLIGQNRNYLGFRDPVFDRLARDYEIAADDARRRALSSAMQRLLNEKAPAAFLVSELRSYAYRREIVIPVEAVDNFGFFTYANRWQMLPLSPR
jgi:peptide/nickel transport system substrate-binding protein